MQVRRGARDEPACRPGSVPGRLAASRSAAIHLGLPLPTASCGLPASSGGPPSNARARSELLFLTLLQVGFTKPFRSPGTLVVSYTTVSPLPTYRSAPAVCSLWHFPAGHPGWVLPTTSPCGARTFLDESPRRGRPAGSSRTSLDLEADRAGANLCLREPSAYVDTERQLLRRPHGGLDRGLLHDQRTVFRVVVVHVHHDRVELLTDPLREHRGLHEVEHRLLVAAGAMVGLVHRLRQRVQPVQHPRRHVLARAQRHADLARVAVAEPAQRRGDVCILGREGAVLGLLRRLAVE